MSYSQNKNNQKMQSIYIPESFDNRSHNVGSVLFESLLGSRRFQS